MATVIKIIGSASGEVSKHDGEYITGLDVDFRGGLGHAYTSPDIAKAKRFDTMFDALQFWKTQSKVKPVREDGKPNRPCTAFNVECPTVDE